MVTFAQYRAQSMYLLVTEVFLKLGKMILK